MNRVCIITNSSDTGLNYLQMMEIVNVLGGKGLEIQTIKDPEAVSTANIKRSDRIILIVPEWNGSFPWMFKKMIDDSGWPSAFFGKKILLIGTSNTTFGNIMGITHLQHILEWCGAKVNSKKLCIPQIQEKFKNNDIVVDQRLNKTVIDFCS